MKENDAIDLSRALLELKAHLEAIEARGACADLMIDSLVRRHADVPALRHEWEKAIAAHADAARHQPVLTAALHRLAVLVDTYGTQAANDGSSIATAR